MTLLFPTAGDIMIDYTYVECTSASIQALKHFTDHNSYRQEDIRSATLLCHMIIVIGGVTGFGNLLQAMLVEGNPIHSRHSER